jgi:small subunit ribosomal protein S15
MRSRGKRHETDTGSPEVQVAILTRRIAELSAHLDKNRKDLALTPRTPSLVAARRKHLKYLETSNKRVHSALIKKLGLKK